MVHPYLTSEEQSVLRVAGSGLSSALYSSEWWGAATSSTPCTSVRADTWGEGPVAIAM